MPPAPRIPVIVGPTAGGKTGLAVEVAMEFARRGLSEGGGEGSGPGGGRGEIISADAFQVYRGMDIGTGKATADEQRGVAHHLLDILEPDASEPFTVVRWLELAERAIGDIRARSNLPIVVGGTHLYIKSFMEGMFEGPGADEGLRAELRGLKSSALRAELERIDPEAAGRIHPNDQRRTIRAIEVFRLTGRPISDHQAQWDRASSVRPDAFLVGLDWPSEQINRRINARVKQMVEAGFVEEVRGLVETGRLEAQAREALGYKQLAAWLEAGADPDQLAETIERIKIETRRFAKSQRTWLRRLRLLDGSVWLNPAETDQTDMARVVVDRAMG
ncbi:MAG: tRNA (adenosine(37)-N6)-dimethylallyltransferase MiaA [Planctomycetota bacterium]|nr:tRNA (adenosine(37)-N6)-dimethylallyltransferase MiaA [Planctomycetota bacterium]